MDRETLTKAWRLARKILLPVLIVILAMAMAQTLPFDLAILLAGDTLIYLEVFVAVWLTARLGAARAATTLFRHHIGRLTARVRRRRATKPKRLSPSNDDDPEPGWPRLAAA